MKEFIIGSLPGCSYSTLQEAIAEIKRHEEQFNVTDVIRIIVCGMQQINETIRITPEQLPLKKCPIVIEGADANSGFSGGIQVSQFARWKDNIWCAKVPEVEFTRHLYIDGKLAKRPTTSFRKPFRWDVLEAEDYEFSNLPGEKEKTCKYSNHPGHEAEIPDWSGIATTHTEIADWKNIRDLEMVFEVGWVHRVVPIERVEYLPDGRLYIKPLEPAFRSARTVEGVQIGGCPSYIENVFELLGKPFEWYFDRNEQMLYVGFEDGDSPDNHEIVIPLVEQLIEVKGALDCQPCHLRFKNVHFKHTTWLFPQK